MKKTALILIVAVLACTARADLNGLEALSNAWLSQTGEPSFNADIDYVQDGIINFSDFAFYVLPEAYIANKIYFVSASSGLDTNPGTIDRPLKTITKAASLAQSGNTVFIRSGTYREQITPARSGTLSDPIRYKGYLSEYPVVSGADIVTGSWSVYQGSIYSARLTTFSSEQLFVDGKMYNKARWPNTNIEQLVDMNRALADSGTSATTLVDDALPPGNWVNAKVHIVPGDQWISFSKTISAYTPGVNLTFSNSTWSDNSVWYIPRQGNKYWLSGSLDGLDIAGEWIKSGTRVYIWCEGNDSPANHLIEAKKRTHAFDLSNLSYIQVKGFKIVAAAVLMDNSSSCLIEDCHIKFIDHFDTTDGYNTSHNYLLHQNRMSGSNNIWKDCSIAYSAGNGILDRGLSNTVTNCIIHDVDYMATYASALYCHADSDQGIYTYNNLYKSGRYTFWHEGTRFNCSHNDLHHAGYLTEDLGMTYTWRYDGMGAQIAYNYVHDNLATIYSKGIYIDGGYNYVIHHNLIWNIPDSAIILSSPNLNLYVYNNTILSSCNHGFSGAGSPLDQSTCKIINNLVKPFIGWFASYPYNPELHHNGNYAIDANSWPSVGSGAINSGYVIPGITDNFVGSAPDIGCYEVGTEGWTAGADWTEFAW